jgi:hypothetical protein
VPSNTSLVSSPGAANNAGVLSWSVASLGIGGTQNFTFVTSFSGLGSRIDNQAAAAATNQSFLQSNLCEVAVGATFTNTPTPSSTTTASPTPTPTATATIVLGPPQLSLSMVRDQGEPWYTGGDISADNLGFSISFTAQTGCACATAQDLVLTFHSDINHGDQGLDVVQAMNLVGLGSITDPQKNFYWKASLFTSDGISTGTFSVSPGNSVQRQVFAAVVNNPLYNNLTITSEVVLSSATYGIAITSTVSTFVYALQPPNTPVPSPTATPIAGVGQVAAYPQPAHDHVCLAYFAPGPGDLRIEIFNAAFQRVAVVTDHASGGHMETACVPISQLTTGVYFYKAKVGSFSFPTSQFGVTR